MLELKGVNAFYGKSRVLNEIDLKISEGETVALLGRNGAGKSTALKAIMGLVTSDGDIQFEGRTISGLAPFQVVRHGITYVPEDRGVFGSLSVEQNLVISQRKGAKWDIPQIYRQFPRLADRRSIGGDNLSGGEQQMLAIARSLLGAPRLVMLDEPSEGLAPIIVEQVRDVILEMKSSGLSVLLVEQQLDLCMQVADSVYVLESGRMVYSGTKDDFWKNEEIRRRHLSLQGA